jgi:hypothetical protein
VGKLGSRLIVVRGEIVVVVVSFNVAGLERLRFVVWLCFMAISMRL